MNKNLIDKATISNIAYMYCSEAVISPSDENYEELINTNLATLNEKLHTQLEYEGAEEVFNLIIDYGEAQGQKYFEEGVMVGIKLAKEISKI
ncbi:hypothetical protein [Aminipila terrae]|uniref:Uncharacterized protein n=1 Tax=Aminipila terrae TaxID=2697030 RepID=A0A6P1MHL5_9FIRM|nr:hypothetical protein [Aminipila terrae]QHI72673.1 hypothetical protein Ami3637_09925 [Aminipila terrae]